MKLIATLCKILISVGLAVPAGLAAPQVNAEAARGVPDGPTRLLRFADISADRVVFTYAYDLWIAPRNGGSATRLTSHVNDERFPKFSPDGKWIAFTAEYDGNLDVYVISSEGGQPKRLTYHPSADIVLDWTPDGTGVLFRSDRFAAPQHRYSQLFVVTPQGGTPKQLPVPRASATCAG